MTQDEPQITPDMLKAQSIPSIPLTTVPKIPLNTTVADAIDDCIKFLEKYKENPGELSALSCAQLQLQGIIAIAQVAVHTYKPE